MSDCRKCAKAETCAVDEDCGLFIQKTMTNADRIRAMTDEELAEFLAKSCAAVAPLILDNKNYSEKDVVKWQRWLKQEVDDDTR